MAETFKSYSASQKFVWAAKSPNIKMYSFPLSRNRELQLKKCFWIKTFFYKKKRGGIHIYAYMYPDTDLKQKLF